MGFFDGPAIGGTSPRIGAGKYSELEILHCKVFEGKAAQGGTRFIVEFRVNGDSEHVPGTGDGRTVPHHATPKGSVCCFSTRLDDGYGYGLGETFALLAAASGKPADKDVANQAISEAQPFKSKKVSAIIFAKPTGKGHVAKGNWMPAGTLKADPSVPAPTDVTPAAKPDLPPPPAEEQPAAKTYTELGWRDYPGMDGVCHNGQVSKRIADVEAEQLTA